MDLYFAATLIGFVVLTSAVGKVLFLALRGFVTFVLARHLPIGVAWRDYSGWAGKRDTGVTNCFDLILGGPKAIESPCG